MGVASRWLLTSVLALAQTTGASAGEPQQEIPINLRDGYLILVEGSVKGGYKLNLLIDTGSEYSVVDKHTAQRLDLTLIPQEVKIQAFGRKTKAERAVVPGLTLGPATHSFPCLAADILFSDVNAIIGLDLLRRYDFTIDYQARRMIFEKTQEMEGQLPFGPESRLVIVQLRLGDQTLRMSVDTGIDGICLYEERGKRRLAGQKSAELLSVAHLGGETPGRQMLLNQVFLGGWEWRGLKAALLHPAQPVERDGTLGIAALGLARVHFDFERCLISWTRWIPSPAPECRHGLLCIRGACSTRKGLRIA